MMYLHTAMRRFYLSSTKRQINLPVSGRSINSAVAGRSINRPAASRSINMSEAMRIFACSLAAVMMAFCSSQPLLARQFELALPGFKFDFPRDHASHNAYKTEWWYYTGHLNSDDGREFGYELTFFRSALDVSGGVKDSAWSVDNVYLAHFAVSDMPDKKFFHTAKLNRSGVDFAGASTTNYHVWNQNWTADLLGDVQKIAASSEGYSLALKLEPLKPPVIHGENGVSQKASCRGCASHYYSFTRLKTDGEITIGGKPIHVHGTSWMDHEFGSNQIASDQAGWDWYSVQLDDNSELMLYTMRKKDGTIDPNSSGTVVSADGGSSHLTARNYAVKSTDTWRSPTSGGTYPMGWTIEIPTLQMTLKIEPLMLNQELDKQRSSDVSYWEGACKVTGTKAGRSISGKAYVEMTGYAGAFNAGI